MIEAVKIFHYYAARNKHTFNPLQAISEVPLTESMFRLKFTAMFTA